MNVLNCTTSQGSSRNPYDPQTKIWTGAVENSESYTSLGKHMLECLLKNPKHIEQICCHNGKEYTNQEIADAALSIACHLKELGFQQGEVVGFMCSNTEYVASLVIGALLNGLAVSTLDTSFEKESIMHIFSLTKPSIMFCDGLVHARVTQAFKEMGLTASIYTMTDHIEGVPSITEFMEGYLPKDEIQFEPLRDGGNQIAFIMCSSGTTGLPKGVCVSHVSLRDPYGISYLQDEGSIFCYSSLYWGSGIIALTRGILHGSTRLITKNPFSAEEFLEIVQKFKPSMVISPPSHLAVCLASPNIKKCDFSSIKTYLCGGSSVSPSLIAKIQPFMPSTKIIVAYGMTEVPCFGITIGPASENGTVGKLVRNVELKIIDDDNKCLGPNEIGEMLVRTNLPFAGYFANKAATAAACDKEGWIHSGDLGYMSEDGSLFIVGRKKDIYKYNNFHFYPAEIESKIMEISDVVEACVCGIPDEISSFLPAAMVVPKTGSKITEKDIYERVANEMDHFKHLRGGVYFVENIPKTPSGKHIRRQVAEMCLTLRNNKNN